MNPNERRMKILKVLCERRYEKIMNLVQEFGVSRVTVIRDLQVISLSYPIYTTQGNGGGVHILDGYKLGMKYLTDEQMKVLTRISKNLIGTDLKVVQSILSTFSKPKGKI